MGKSESVADPQLAPTDAPTTALALLAIGFRQTGRHYRAVVIDAELAQALLAVPKANPIVEPPVTDRHRWFERDLAAWCKPFTGAAKKPLHRLRGLYADDVAKLTEDAVLARLEGIKEASRALGHTTTKTTLDHYLSATPTPRKQGP